MIDLDGVIRHFGPRVVESLKSDAEGDAAAICAMRSTLVSGQPAIDRVAEIRRWLTTYRVFQGLDGRTRTKITEAILRWCDSQEEQADLEPFDALVGAHEKLMEECCDAHGSARDFTSLCSKALWLRYPDVVPLFDSFA